MTPDDLATIRGRGYRNGAVGAEACKLSDDAAIDVPKLLAEIDRLNALVDAFDRYATSTAFRAEVDASIRRAK